MFLFLRDRTRVFSDAMRVLHFAPEPALKRVFESHGNLDYVTTDLLMRGVSVRSDICDLIFKDDVFDCVVCSHVLEHVPDDRRAMRELGRVLRPGGFALILVPILRPPGGRTYEDGSIVEPAERLRAFGQEDHVRMYGQDFPARLAEEGFDVEVVAYPQELGAEATSRFGLIENEQLFVCRTERR
jgi:SAM-dependent methyltransferase